MNKHIKSGDQVTIISGGLKGKSGKIVKIDRKAGLACVEGLNVRTRHLKKTQWNPTGGKKDIHVGIDLSKLKVTEAAKTAKVAKAAKPAKSTKATKAKKESK